MTAHQAETERLRVFLLESPVATITIPITCEVTATPEFVDGKVSVVVVADDGTELANAEILIRQEQVTKEEGLSSGIIVGSIGVILVLLIVGAVVTVMLMRRQEDDEEFDEIESYGAYSEVQNPPAVQIETVQPVMGGPPLQNPVELAPAQVSGPPVVVAESEPYTPTVCGDCGYGFHPGSPWVSCITCGAARHPQCAMNTPSCWTCHSSSNETTNQ